MYNHNNLVKKPLVALTALFILAGTCGFTSAVTRTSTYKTSENTIPIPKGYKIGGAAAYKNGCDHTDSPYFKQLDYYKMKSSGSLTLIPHFKTYQQTTETTCGPCSALMNLYHFGNKKYKELDLAKSMETDKHGGGTEAKYVVNFYKKIGWHVISSLSEGKLKNNGTFKDMSKFTPWVIKNLKKQVPIMVEWIDWSGHWQDIIGYDTMGTAAEGDDVLVLADPYDTSDHCQDGYYTFNAERFYYMWHNGTPRPKGFTEQQWVIATPSSVSPVKP